MVACCALCKTDEQFKKIKQPLNRLLELEPLVRIDDDGEYTFLDGNDGNEGSTLADCFKELSEVRIVEFLKLQLKDGSDLNVVTTLAAIEVADRNRLAGRDIMQELFKHDAEIVQLADQRSTPLPSGVSGFFEMLKSKESNTDRRPITPVETVADLVLTVQDPKGPLPTGEEAEYQITVQNQGRKSARSVKLLMQFSDGIEPAKATGFQNRIEPGQVIFAPISKIDPGQKMTFQVAAIANKRGTHIFRTFLSCEDSNSREVAEGTTKFVGDKAIEGKTLAQWQTILETDQGALEQAKALKACAIFFAKNSRNDELVAMLQKFLSTRPPLDSFDKDDDEYNRFIGFAEALGELPSTETADFLESQIKEGSAITLEWTFAGLFARRGSTRQYASVTRELRSRAFDLLTLIAQRKKDGSVSYLFKFIVKSLLTKPLSVESLDAIKSVLVAIEPIEFLKAIKFVPKNLITRDLFASTKTKLFAKETSAKERDKLITALTNFNDNYFNREAAAAIDEILAAVLANQLFESTPIEFDEFQKMEILFKKDTSEVEVYRSTETDYGTPMGYKKIEIKDPAVVPRRLLNALCKRNIQDKKKDDRQPAIAKIYAVIEKAPSDGDQESSGGSKFFEVLKIQQDLDALKKFANKQHGEFSDFTSIMMDREF